MLACGQRGEVESTGKKRRRYGSGFEARGALAGIRGDEKSAELASEFGVHGNQLSAWKRQFLESASTLFEDGRQKQGGAK